MINWRIYYDDESTYSNEDGEWVDAPKHGVVVVVVAMPDPHWARIILSGYSPLRKEYSLPYPLPTEIYIKAPDSDEPFVTNSSEPFLDKYPGREDLIKYGRQVDQLKWQEIQTRAGKDKDFRLDNNFKRRKTDFYDSKTS